MSSTCSSSSSLATFDGPYDIVLETVTPLKLGRPSPPKKLYSLSMDSFSSLNSTNSSPSTYSIDDSPRQEFDSPRSLDGYMGYKPIRPLPSVPGSAPATCHPSKATFRPLPLPPPSPSPVQPSISISPASPMSSDMPARDVDLPYPLPNPHPRIQPPPRVSSRHRANPFSSLSLDVSEQTLAPPAYKAREDDALCPLAPSPVISVTEAPTPVTDRNRRISRLRRHLGEGIPDELIPFMCATDAVKARLKSLRESRSEDDLYSACKSTLDFGKALEGKDESDDDDDDDDDSIEIASPLVEEKVLNEPEQQQKETNALPKDTYRAGSSKRYSAKWIREKGGRRWEEQDYKALMNALRAL
ncbi:hypothetical protein VKT23_009050 [Stygiomarasmius scandens]|uniref:Uncharacterized protein n=1 Tax=Marasmiellus scandens TaxID=2682957 RepID=A0ABR1JMF0_9AGAR